MSTLTFHLLELSIKLKVIYKGFTYLNLQWAEGFRFSFFLDHFDLICTKSNLFHFFRHRLDILTEMFEVTPPPSSFTETKYVIN